MKEFVNLLKRFAKGLFCIYITMILSYGIMLSLNSCKKDEAISADKAIKKWVASYNLNLNAFALTNISSNESATRNLSKSDNSENSLAESDIQISESTSVYLLYPKNTREDIKSLSKEIATIQDLSDLIRLTDAVLQYQPNKDNIEYKVEVSESKIIESLNPLIQNAKKYLYDKGFTVQEVQDMIKENDAHETDLVPFVLKLSEAELSESVLTSETRQCNTIFFSLFSTPSYARGLEAMDYAECALEAVGLDVFYSLNWSSARTWTKATMKRAFSAVVKRALGPIGAAITAISFGYCIYRKYKSYDCVYALPIPSDIEKSYKQLTESQK